MDKFIPVPVLSPEGTAAGKTLAGLLVGETGIKSPRKGNRVVSAVKQKQQGRCVLFCS